ncbi:MAG: phosphomannomutase/phosphoglucomutase, partial [Candidatus Woesearchaeota archaeon]
MSIFREYDIRGIYPSELDENIAYTLGVAVSKFLNQKEIVVGRDGRVSSPSLHKYFVKGVIDSGLDVIDIGLVSTPIFYFACLTMQKKGVMITASHNPK